jgi:hypothetical protein
MPRSLFFHPEVGKDVNTLLKVWTVVGCCGLAACVYKPQGSPSPRPVTLTWAAATDAGTKPITYNVYAVPGAGPIPTEPPKACGVTPVAKSRPLNSEPIAATTYSTSVAEGLWTFAVEAVSPDGCRSPLSSSITVTVPIPGDSSANVTEGP